MARKKDTAKNIRVRYVIECVAPGGNSAMIQKAENRVAAEVRQQVRAGEVIDHITHEPTDAPPDFSMLESTTALGPDPEDEDLEDFEDEEEEEEDEEEEDDSEWGSDDDE